MTRTRERRAPILSRRRLLASGAIGSAALAGGHGACLLAASAHSAQIDSTPPAPPATLTTVGAGETAAEVAARLNYDAEAIFRFVAKEVAYESYDGVLRGPVGTLWARAGNSADQAVLLGAMLEAAEIPHRFAVGALPGARSESLAAQLAPTAEVARSHYEASATAAALSALGLDAPPEEAPQLSVADQEYLDLTISLASEAIGRASESAIALSTTIGEALAEAGVELPPLAAPALTARETDQHVWIQVADGPIWIDLDPTDPEAAYGAATTEPAATFDVVPEEWNHAITIKVAVDEMIGGAITRRDVVSIATTSQRTVDTMIGISMAPAESLQSVGLGITQLFTSQMTIYPSILMGEEVTEASQPMVFATDGASAVGVLDGGEPIVGAGEGETIAAWLVVEITSPDAAPVVVERALLDRLPPADRAGGTFTPETVTPISVATNVMGEEMLSAFTTFTMVQIECARIPSQHILAKLKNQSVAGALDMLGPGLAGLRNALGLDQEARVGAWSYPSAPNVTAFTYEAVAPDSAEGERRVSADLLYRQRTSMPLAGDAGSEVAVHPLVLSGVLNAVAEEVLLAPETRGASTAPEPSIGTIFARAAESGVGIVAVSTVDDLSRVTADEVSVALMTTGLEGGQVVVVPEQPVELDGVPFTGWWLVDPATGRTGDQLQNGQSYAASIVLAMPLRVRAQDTMAWYARWIAWFDSLALEYQCLGMAIGILVLVVESVIAFSLIPGAAGGGIGGALGGAAAAGAIPFVRGC